MVIYNITLKVPHLAPPVVVLPLVFARQWVEAIVRTFLTELRAPETPHTFAAISLAVQEWHTCAQNKSINSVRHEKATCTRAIPCVVPIPCERRPVLFPIGGVSENLGGTVRKVCGSGDSGPAQWSNGSGGRKRRHSLSPQTGVADSYGVRSYIPG